MKEKIKIALAQISCKRENKTENIKKIKELTEKAKTHGADLIIFPELSLTGYIIRDQVYEMAETIPGPSTKKIEEIAKKTNLHIIFGMAELSQKTKATVFNTAVFIGPKGLIGKYRKMYLPTHSVFEEKRYYRLGYQAAAFDTPIGKVGLCICYDIFFPEVSRLTRLLGAQLIVCISASPAIRRSYFELLTASRALENTTFLAYVNLVGIEEGLQFWGGSRLISPTGEIIAKACYDEEDFTICELNFNELKTVEPFIPTLRDLRPELFEELKKAAKDL
jgi:predicted amidohydrolase